jgi:hypothetical protein
VQAVDGGDVLQPTGGDHLGRALRHRLLGGLEEQPDPAGKLVVLGELGQRQTDTEQDRGVHVVPAGVRDTIHRRPVRHVLGVRQRQGVKVGPERDHAIATADVADDAVALGQEPGLQADHGQLPSHESGGLELLMRELRVRVNMTPYGYELSPSGGQPTVELAWQWIGPGWRLGPGRRHRTAHRQRQRTRHGRFSISVRGILENITNLGQPRPEMVTLRNVITVVVKLRSVTKSAVKGVCGLRIVTNAVFGRRTIPTPPTTGDGQPGHDVIGGNPLRGLRAAHRF